MNARKPAPSLHSVPTPSLVTYRAGENYSKATYGGGRACGIADHDGVAIDGVLVRPDVLAEKLAELGWTCRKPENGRRQVRLATQHMGKGEK